MRLISAWIGSAIAKSISATCIGSTSLGNLRHFDECLEYSWSRSGALMDESFTRLFLPICSQDVAGESEVCSYENIVQII
jgi:hypothetical protein